MYNINKHIIRETYNIFGGISKKKTVILDDESRYMLKLPSEEKTETNETIYADEIYAEYIGCKIAKSIGLSVQDVILGEYTYNDKTVPACLCKDLTYNKQARARLVEFDKLALSNMSEGTNDYGMNFEYENKLIESIEEIVTYHVDIESFREHFYEQFILDTLIGNPNRTNSNMAILVDEEATRAYRCPIYDCSSAFSNLFTPLIITEDGRAIEYADYLANVEDINVDKALCRLLPDINLAKIGKIIDNSDIPQNKKTEYKNKLELNYNALLSGFNRIINKDIDITKINYSNIELKNQYKEKIEPIKKLPVFDKYYIETEQGKYLNAVIMRVSDDYAIILNDNRRKAIGLLNLSSDINTIKESLSKLKQLEEQADKKQAKIQKKLKDNITLD